MPDDWDESGIESGGITLGPEERLEREISKVKALKVERLQLRDRIAHLEEQVGTLSRENKILKSRNPDSHFSTPGVSSQENPMACQDTGTCRTWTWGFWTVAILGVLALLYYEFGG